MDEAGAVEQHVDRADLGDRRVDGGVVEHIELARRDIGLPGELGERRLVDVGRDDLGAGAGEGEHARLADPLPGRRDQHCLVPRDLPSLVPC